jgi:diguanylate cyclase (GGDEF)-like protein
MPASDKSVVSTTPELARPVTLHPSSGWFNRAARTAAPFLREWKLVPVNPHGSTETGCAGPPAYLMRYTLRDFLTQLPNRATFSDRLDAALERARAHEEFAFALLCIDMDRFQIVNESLGRAVGDELLVAAAERIDSILGRQGTLARVGGDRFAAIIENVVPESLDAVAAGISDSIQAAFTKPLVLARREVFASASIGIVVVKRQYESAEDVLRDADIALFTAKQNGKARAAIFRSDMHDRAVQNLDLEMDLRHAIERREFEMYYQPIVNAKTGEFSAYEALVRWRHPVRGILQPASFLPILMENRFIVQLGKWVIAEVCRQAGEWASRCGRIIPISLNLSAREFGEPGIAGDILKAIALSGVEARSIKLEITEDALVAYAGTGAETMSTLSDHGLHLLIDDFGTGYSSLGYLGRLPVQGLKVPRELVWAMEKNVQGHAIVASIVALAHTLGMEVIAEGVENLDQLGALSEMGCDYVQGFLISRPMNAAAAFGMLGCAPDVSIFTTGHSLPSQEGCTGLS